MCLPRRQSHARDPGRHLVQLPLGFEELELILSILQGGDGCRERGEGQTEATEREGRQEPQKGKPAGQVAEWRRGRVLN